LSTALRRGAIPSQKKRFFSACGRGAALFLLGQKHTHSVRLFYLLGQTSHCASGVFSFFSKFVPRCRKKNAII